MSVLRGPLLLLAISVAAADRPAVAAELGPPGGPGALEVHGFVSQGLLKSTDNKYLADTERGSFEFSEVGINFTTQLTDRLRLGMQIFARKLGAVGNFNAKTDWFYLDYRWRDWLGLRAGRVKLPFGLYNDTSDIDAARVPVLLPQSVYPDGNRDFLLAQTGFELYGYLAMGAAGALDYRLYAGTIFLQLNNTPGAPLVVQTVQIPYLTGGRLMWETPVDGWRVGASMQALRLDTTIAAGMASATVKIPAILWVASSEYVVDDWLFAVEYSQWHVKATSDNQAVFPDAQTVVSQRAYGLVAWRATTWLQPAVYYSMLFPDMDNRLGRENMQHDVSATLRFDINPYWLVKLEGHYLHGTAALDPALNGLPRSLLARDWALFLVKTTAYF